LSWIFVLLRHPSQWQKQKQNREWIVQIANKTQWTEFSVLSEPLADKTGFVWRNTSFTKTNWRNLLDRVIWLDENISILSWNGHKMVITIFFHMWSNTFALIIHTEWFDWVKQRVLHYYWFFVSVLWQGQFCAC